MKRKSVSDRLTNLLSVLTDCPPLKNPIGSIISQLDMVTHISMTVTLHLLYALLLRIANITQCIVCTVQLTLIPETLQMTVMIFVHFLEQISAVFRGPATRCSQSADNVQMVAARPCHHGRGGHSILLPGQQKLSCVDSIFFESFACPKLNALLLVLVSHFHTFRVNLTNKSAFVLKQTED